MVTVFLSKLRAFELDDQVVGASPQFTPLDGLLRGFIAFGADVEIGEAFLCEIFMQKLLQTVLALDHRDTQVQEVVKVYACVVAVYASHKVAHLPAEAIIDV